MVAIRGDQSAADPGARGKPGGRIDTQAAVGCNRAGAKRQRRHMSFADGTQAENEAQSALRRVRLVGVRHDAGVEQSRGFERVFIEEIGADQLAPVLGKGAVGRHGLFHDLGPGLERLQRIAVPALKILQDIGELGGSGLSARNQPLLPCFFRLQYPAGFNSHPGVPTWWPWHNGKHRSRGHPRRPRPSCARC